MKIKTRNYIITFGSLAALILGFIAGMVLKETNWKYDSQFIMFFDLAGKIWVNLLIILVIPLSVSYLVNVILLMTNTNSLRKLSGYALLVHTRILISGIIFSVVLGFAFVELFGDNLPTLSAQQKVVGNSVGLVEGNMFLLENFITLATKSQQILGKIVLMGLLFSVVFAFVVARFWNSFAKVLLPLSQKTSEISMKWLQLLLLTLPLAVFSLILPLVKQTGFNIIGVAGINVVVLSFLLICFMALMYLAVHFWGKESISSFARSIYSAQIVAASTRSSLATIPSLLHSAETKMGVPKSISAIIIPFFISVFRLNRVISGPFKFIFLSYVYRLEIDIFTFLSFIVIQIIISFGSPGIPSGG